MPPKRGRGRGRPENRSFAETGDAPIGRGRGQPGVPHRQGEGSQRSATQVYQPPALRGAHGGAYATSEEYPSLLRGPPMPEVQTPRFRQSEEDVTKSMSEISLKGKKEGKPKPDSSQFPVQSTAQQPVASEAAAMPIEVKLKPRDAKTNVIMAPRPSPGNKGNPIALVANYFMLKYKDINIYHYDVDIIFLKQERKQPKKDASGTSKGKAPFEEASHVKGRSLMQEGKTVKEAIESKLTHKEHQQKRAPGKQRCREIITQWIIDKKFHNYFPVYDGQKNMYTSTPLPFDKEIKHEVILDEEDKKKFFQVLIKPVERQADRGGNKISIEPLFQLYRSQGSIGPANAQLHQDIIMAYDTVMNHRFPPFDQVQVGRSFFMLNQERFNLGSGMEIWFGYNQSVRLTQRGPAVIINYSAKAFHKAGNVIDYASEIVRYDITRGPIDPRDIKKLEEALSKIRVTVNHMPYKRKYIVSGVTKQSAKDLVTTIGDSKRSVAEYFRQKYRPLQFPFLPCLKMRSNTNNTFLPFEVCEIPEGQPVFGKLSSEATSKMIRQTAMPPKDRFNAIVEEARVVNNKSKKNMDAFGLLMNLQPLEFNGRVLIAPSLMYREMDHKPNVAKPIENGTWRIDGMHFLKPPPNDGEITWMLISFAKQQFCRPDCLDKVANILCSTARNVGIRLAPVKTILADSRIRTRDALDRAKRSGVTFAVVVLSTRDPFHTYEEVKFIADIQLRLITQCLDEGTVVKKFNPLVATNVLLKVHAKIGGVNHGFAQKPKILSRPVIIFGADAVHSPRGFACPSIAAVVGSLDGFPARYAVTCRVQENTDESKISQEIILDMKNMAKDILATFKRNTRGKYPEKIVFFRDGVSEGQFSMVIEQEIPAIQLACKEELDENIPPITYIVVQKRHQTRVRPKNERQGVGRMRNVPPGTVMDTDIVHPTFFDFFLCSHEGIQGTSKPAHYTVLLDENNFSSDELQELCFHLCHTYVRCNRSVSIPAPVLYADLACTRAKKYADMHLRDDASSTSSGSRRSLPTEVESAITHMGNFETGMFYV